MPHVDLTDRQRKFITEYIKNPVAGLAAEAAGYSSHASSRAGIRLLKDPRIASEIKAINDEKLRDAKVSATWVLEESVQRYKDAVAANNLTLSAKFLQIIGDHVDVGAWKSKEDKNPAQTNTLNQSIFNYIVQHVNKEEKLIK